VHRVREWRRGCKRLCRTKHQTSKMIQCLSQSRQDRHCLRSCYPLTTSDNSTRSAHTHRSQTQLHSRHHSYTALHCQIQQYEHTDATYLASRRTITALQYHASNKAVNIVKKQLQTYVRNSSIYKSSIMATLWLDIYNCRKILRDYCQYIVKGA